MSELEKLPIRGGYIERLGASGRLVFELESGEIATVTCDVVPGPPRADEPEEFDRDELLENERAALDKAGDTEQATDDLLDRERAAHEEEERKRLEALNPPPATE